MTSLGYLLSVIRRFKSGRFRTALISTFLLCAIQCAPAGPGPGATEIIVRIDSQNISSGMVAGVQRVISRRLSELGITNASVKPRADKADEIVVLLPAGADIARAKASMSQSHRLEFKLVAEGPADSPAGLLAPHGGKTPEGHEVVRAREPNENGSPQFYLVSRDTVLSNDDIRTARPVRDEYNLPAVGVTLTSEAAAKLDRVTGNNVGRQLAIILDDIIQSAPRIESRISTPDLRITGSFTEQEATSLVLMLRSGVLPAPIKFVEAGAGK